VPGPLDLRVGLSVAKNIGTKARLGTNIMTNDTLRANEQTRSSEDYRGGNTPYRPGSNRRMPSQRG